MFGVGDGGSSEWVRVVLVCVCGGGMGVWRGWWSREFGHVGPTGMSWRCYGICRVSLQTDNIKT